MTIVRKRYHLGLWNQAGGFVFVYKGSVPAEENHIYEDKFINQKNLRKMQNGQA